MTKYYPISNMNDDDADDDDAALFWSKWGLESIWTLKNRKERKRSESNFLFNVRFEESRKEKNLTEKI